MKKTYFLVVIGFLLALSFFGSVKAQTNNSALTLEPKEDKIYKSDEVDQKIKITKKSPPRVKNIGKVCGGYSLATKLRVVFHKSGKITNVEITEKSLCDAYDQAVLDVVRKIKFKPAIKNGEPVSQSLTVEYKSGLAL